MGNHSQTDMRIRGVRISGYLAVQHFEVLELTVLAGNNSWPKFANRLQSLGFLVGIDTRMKRIKLIVSEDFETVRRLLDGRASKSKLPKVFLAGIGVPIVALLSLVPLGSGASVSHPEKVSKKVIYPCSPNIISSWIEGSVESGVIKALSTSVLGGVTVGTLDCNGSRYSYTLGSEEPKRVLKLQKLDS
jgi:hypothetical protein